MEININYLSVLAAAVVSMGVGFVWYGVLFRKQWMSLMGITADSMATMKMSANTAYAIQFVASLSMAYVLAHVMVLSSNFFDYSILATATSTAFWMWLGFVAPISLGVVLWEGKSWQLWFINASNYLVSLVLMGIVLAFWM